MGLGTGKAAESSRTVPACEVRAAGSFISKLVYAEIERAIRRKVAFEANPDDHIWEDETDGQEDA
jgi:hypothetical protein